MNGLIRASLRNPHAVTVGVLTVIILGILAAKRLPVDILPVFNSPAVQVLTFYGGMPAESIEKDITSRMERWTGQAAGTARQESRSIVGASIIRNYYRSGTDPNGALTAVNSLASAAIPNLPPGTLPPVILSFDPTSSTPACLIALNSKTQSESILYDTGRYEVRNFIMAIQGAIAPVVYGGKVRAVMAYLDRDKLQARNLSPLDVMNALDRYNLFLPTGDAKFGDTDYAIDSNSMYDLIVRMGDIPIKTERGNAIYLRDVARPQDSNFIQTNVVRVDGRRQVYIPVFRQGGSSTLDVVSALKTALPGMQERLSQPDIGLKLVMDQSVYVRASISALVQEGALGAILCSLVILLFLGEWRMTLIAIITIPVSVLGALLGLYACGMTINVMTLAGLSLAIGPLVDSAIICLENTHRHLGFGASTEDASFLGASEVGMPALVSTLCTFLVLAPLALMPGLGEFLFLPMALAVAFAMIAAYFLSRTLVPSFSALLLKPHAAHNEQASRGSMSRAFGRWERGIDRAIEMYVDCLGFVLRHRWATVFFSFGLLVSTLVVFSPILRREFFPEADAGAFEIYVRSASGTRIEVTEERIARVEAFIKKTLADDLDLVISEIGVTADWSAAYTPNAGPMDSVVKVQLTEDRERSAQEYVEVLRKNFAHSDEFSNLEFAFDSGGMIRGAMNEGKSTPINIRILGKHLELAHKLAEAIRHKVSAVEGVVDCRIMQRLDYPEYIIDVDRAKAADLGLDQADVMRNVVSAFNSSIQFNKHNFWIDPKTHNQYFVGVQYPEWDIKSIETLLDIPITSAVQNRSIPLKNVVSMRRTTVPAEVNHTNLQPSIDLTMGVSGRDLGHVADDITKVLDGFGKLEETGVWRPYELTDPTKTNMITGAKVTLSGEYARMEETFRNLSVGLILASLLIYFLMVALDLSWIVPLTVMLTVPLCLAGVLPVLYFTHTALNVQSLLGIIFVVGIKVANTVLMTDFSQELRHNEGLTPTEAIRKAAAIRVRPITMTALAAFFAMIPGALALERGSEANAPLCRAILGGLLAGEPATLFVLPCLYSLMVRDKKGDDSRAHAQTETNGELDEPT